MKDVLWISELMLLNLSLGSAIYITEKPKMKQLLFLIMLTVLTIAFSAVNIYLWNLTFNLSHLTIINEMRHAYEDLFSSLLHFLF